MKRDEKKAREFLVSLGFKKIIYEPDGNNPPDFLVESSIAIEVRCLNQHKKSYLSDKFEPLENLKYSLMPRVNAILKQYSKISYKNSAFVTIDFARPLKLSKKLFRKIQMTLDDNISQLINIDKRIDIKIVDNLSISIWPVASKYDSAYVLGAFIDDDSGGLVVSEVHKNMLFVIKEKEKKISPYINRYPTWWLVLVDYIGYGLGDYDMNQLNNAKFDKYIFEKIFLLNPLEPTKFNILKN